MMLSRVLQRSTRGARLANSHASMLRDPTRGARLASRRWLRHPPGPRIDETRSRPWDGPRIVRFGTNDPIDRKRHWSAMSEQTRAAWIQLGWNARNWYDGGSDPRLGGTVPWSEKYDWYELHATARAAAERLGYDERLWKLDDDDDGDKEWFIPAIFAMLVVFYGIQALMTRAKWRRVGATREERERLRAYIAVRRGVLASTASRVAASSSPPSRRSRFRAGDNEEGQGAGRAIDKRGGRRRRFLPRPAPRGVRAARGPGERPAHAGVLGGRLPHEQERRLAEPGLGQRGLGRGLQRCRSSAFRGGGPGP